MNYYSTRNTTHLVGYDEAVFKGLAPDGGLYVPETFPDLSTLLHSFTPETQFTRIAGELIAALFPELFSPEQAHRIAREAFPFAPSLKMMKEDHYLLELFHGPSSAFKDFGASFLATVMDEFLKRQQGKAVILTATSGDTGSAVARAFHGKEQIEVVILYPSGRVSPLQEKQLTTLGGNVTALEVDGSFDDCQKMVKQAFMDEELNAKMTLTSANSINLGRLIPQSFYYIWAWAQRKGRGNKLHFCVPSGNFGNLTGGLYGWKWGMDVEGFIAATNANDVVPEYLLSGVFGPRASLHTLSNAMDVGDPSNFERLVSLFEGSVEKMKKMVFGDTVTDSVTKATMKEVYNSFGTYICPHTAVGFTAGERFLNRSVRGKGTEVITLATAHPAKFLEVSKEVLGREPDLPHNLKELMGLEKKAEKCSNTIEGLKAFLMDSGF